MQNQFCKTCPHHSYLVRVLGKETVTSQPEFQDPKFIINSVFLLTIFISSIIKKMNSNNYSNNYSIYTSFKCSQFSACDVTAWTSDLKHSPGTGT